MTRRIVTKTLRGLERWTGNPPELFQAEAAAFGGRSSREARRSEGSSEEPGGLILRPIVVGGGSNESVAASFSCEPGGDEGGKSGSWQGAEFRHGLSASADRDGASVAAFGLRGVSDFRPPQQHEAPRHFEPHPQAFAWASASKESAADKVEAVVSLPSAQTTMIATASQAETRDGRVERSENGTRTVRVAAFAGGRSETT